ncbi:MAG: PDZ domain-containing protein [Verrucomicrobiaceae bacterium]|nr:PDZ domain-containing protein [Verrucomicrobiaceae bacterium]NCF93332.1 PDZ domain-containing protein [Verrucomicrobiaceae bacterium]
MLDLQGRLIGIHSSIGISLSENRHAPISAFKDQWKLMQRGKVVGRLYDWNRREQGFLGIQIDPQSETADVLSVVEGSPAQISGILKGDRIVILDGRPGRRFLQRLRYFNTE